MGEIGRLITAMITPFDEEGGVNYEEARRLALALVESGRKSRVQITKVTTGIPV